MIDKEEWRPICDGRYAVSNMGRVMRVLPGGNATKPGRILKNYKTRKGYVRASLSFNQIQKKPLVHRLVAEAFLGKLPVGLQVNHKDYDRANNRIDNLEYVTPRENSAHSIGNYMASADKMRGNNHPKSKLTECAVRFIRENRGKESASKMAKRFGVVKGTIMHVLSGRNWKHR